MPEQQKAQPKPEPTVKESREQARAALQMGLTARPW
jgi:hypothetical protein